MVTGIQDFMKCRVSECYLGLVRQNSSGQAEYRHATLGCLGSRILGFRVFRVEVFFSVLGSRVIRVKGF